MSFIVKIQWNNDIKFVKIPRIRYLFDYISLAFYIIFVPDLKVDKKVLLVIFLININFPSKVYIYARTRAQMFN